METKEKGFLRRAISSAAQNIDRFTVFLGKVFGCVTVIVTVGLLFYEVIVRYVFNSPTRFTLEVGLIMQIVLVSLASAYALMVGAHVKIELLTERLPHKARNWLNFFNSITGTLFCLLLCVILWRTGSWSLKVGNYTEMLELPLAPLQFLMFGGMALLGVQFLFRSYRSYVLARSPGRAASGDDRYRNDSQ